MEDILAFWFPEGKEPKYWFLGEKNPETDRIITERFGDILNDARKDCLIGKETYDNLLANIILFDQLTRHINRYNRDVIDEDGKIAVTLSIKFLDHLLEKDNPPISHIVFGTIPLRHSKDSIYLKLQNDFIEVMKEKYDYLSGTLWTKFENKNNEVYHSYCFRNPVCLKKTWDNLTDILKEYTDVLDPDVTSVWNLDSDISKHPLYDVVIRSIRKFVPRDKKEVGISISGGVDSMNIARIVASAGYTPICLHIDYRNRDLSFREADFIAKFCKDIGAILYSVPIKFFRRRVTKREDYENITKKIRFSMYQFLIDSYDLSVIALGHHKGDIAENVFTNFCRASNLSDPMVIDELKIIEGVPLWRPMISVYKDVIFDFAHTFGIPYMKDTTPDEVSRGKMRRKWFPSIREHFHELNDKLIEVGKYYREVGNLLVSHIIKPFVDKIVYCKYGFYVNYNGFEDGNHLIWNSFLMNVLHSQGYKMMNTSSVTTLLRNLKKTDYKKHTGHLHFAIITWNYHLIFIDKCILSSNTKPEVIGLEFETEIDGWKFSVNPYEGEKKALTLDELLNGKGYYTMGCDDDDFVICKTLPKHMKKRMKKPFGGINNSILNNFYLLIPEYIPDYPENLVKVTFEKID